MQAFFFFVSLLPLIFGQCNFNTPAVAGGNYVVTNFSTVASCFNAIPLNPSFKTDTLIQVNTLVDLYSFTDISTNSGPPYNLQVDLKASLDSFSRTTFPNDWQFHYQISTLFSKLGDAHTLYVPPSPYRSFSVIRPFFLRSTVVNGNQIITVDNIALIQGRNYAQVTGSLSSNQLSSYIGRQIISINNVPIVDYITKIGSKQSTSKDSSVHFNLGLSGFVVSSIYEIDYDNFTDDYYVFAGVANPVKLTPYIYVGRLFDGVNAFSSLIPYGNRKRSEDMTLKWDPLKERKKMELSLQLQPELNFHENVKRDSVSFTDISTSLEGTATCQRMRRTSDQKIVHYLKLRSFASDEAESSTWSFSFITTIENCVSDAKANGITDVVIDLRGNGGGLVCASFSALLALIEEWNPARNNLLEEKYDIRRTAAMDAYVRSNSFYIPHQKSVTTNLPYNNLNWYNNGVVIPRGNVLNSTYSQKFFFPSCGDYASNGVVMQNYTYQRMTLLTDGLCGSACSLFLSKLRYNGKASVVGVGGIFGAEMESSSFTGGNVEDWEPLASRYSGISSLPTTAAMRVNLRELYTGSETTPRELRRLNPDRRINIWVTQTSTAAEEQEILLQTMLALNVSLPTTASSSTANSVASSTTSVASSSTSATSRSSSSSSTATSTSATTRSTASTSASSTSAATTRSTATSTSATRTSAASTSATSASATSASATSTSAISTSATSAATSAISTSATSSALDSTVTATSVESTSPSETMDSIEVVEASAMKMTIINFAFFLMVFVF